MHVLREILRQKLVLGRSHREVVASVGVSIGKVSSVLARARALGLDAAGVEATSDAELDAGLYPKAMAASLRPEPDCAALHLELRRKGVTLALLHVEFVELHPGGLGYSAFCEPVSESSPLSAQARAMWRRSDQPANDRRRRCRRKGGQAGGHEPI